MPVVKVRLSTLSNSFPCIKLSEILEKLPYIGLDIEGVDEDNDIIRIEFNPNRPDYASENGIIRALMGLFEIKVGLPIINDVCESDCVIDVDDTLAHIRPVICGFIAKRKDPLNEYEISQLISMQEDLHNGLGRKRKKSSIGLHNLDPIVFPLKYTTVSKNFSFIPLDKKNEITIEHILSDLDTGKEYGHIVNNSDRIPLLFDYQKKVLSLPPIINGNLTKITLNTKNLLVEVTSTSNTSALDVLSILSFELYEMGFKIYSIQINSPLYLPFKTPILNPLKITISPNHINKILGLDLSDTELIKCLEKSRCSGKILDNGIECYIPRYRNDIFNPVDISEEVAIGYGIYQFNTFSPPTLYFSGKKHTTSIIFNSMREILIGLGFIEIINTNIISKKIIDDFFLKTENNSIVSIRDSKNAEFEILRNSIIPSMMITLSKNIHEKYPQKLFEIGKTFQIQNSMIKEEWSLGVVIAHNNTDYTEIKSVLESLLKYCFNKKIKTPHFNFEYYLKGHSAKILLNESEIGEIGVVYPQVLENFKLKTLVTAFHINLDRVIRLLNLYKIKYI
jgi:phenylalanyl-tRNA synthetase beta chain